MGSFSDFRALSKHVGRFLTPGRRWWLVGGRQWATAAGEVAVKSQYPMSRSLVIEVGWGRRNSAIPLGNPCPLYRPSYVQYHTQGCGGGGRNQAAASKWSRPISLCLNGGPTHRRNNDPVFRDSPPHPHHRRRKTPHAIVPCCTEANGSFRAIWRFS